MVTIFNLCQAHGFTDRVTCSVAGSIMSHWFVTRNLHGRIITESTEPHGTFSVWAYPDECTEKIEECIREANAKINAHILGENTPEINQLQAEMKAERARGKRPRIQARREQHGS